VQLAAVLQAGLTGASDHPVKLLVNSGLK
jgi:hypothetical protein